MSGQLLGAWWHSAPPLPGVPSTCSSTGVEGTGEGNRIQAHSISPETLPRALKPFPHPPQGPWAWQVPPPHIVLLAAAVQLYYFSSND